MHIGITYDLRDDYLAAGYSLLDTAEFDSLGTIEAIERALGQLGHGTDRIGGGRKLVERLAAGHRWNFVFNICEGMRSISREAQVPAILDLYQIPYTFSDACMMAVCLDKALTKRLLQNMGLPTPAFSKVEHLQEVSNFASWAFPLFAKPIAEGTSKGISSDSKAQDIRDLEKICERLLNHFHQPVLVETFLPGREFTVGVLGTGSRAKTLGTLEIILREEAEPEVYSFENKERCEELVEYRLVRGQDDPVVSRAEWIALHAWQQLGCRDAGRIDLRCDRLGSPQLIEINPLAGLNPTHSDLPMLATAVGMPFVDLIDQILQSAFGRLNGSSLPSYHQKPSDLIAVEVVPELPDPSSESSAKKVSALMEGVS
jgi:D-alanine-D-alanine ligase